MAPPKRLRLRPIPFLPKAQAPFLVAANNNGKRLRGKMRGAPPVDTVSGEELVPIGGAPPLCRAQPQRPHRARARQYTPRNWSDVCAHSGRIITQRALPVKRTCLSKPSKCNITTTDAHYKQAQWIAPEIQP